MRPNLVQARCVFVSVVSERIITLSPFQTISMLQVYLSTRNSHLFVFYVSHVTANN